MPEEFSEATEGTDVVEGLEVEEFDEADLSLEEFEVVSGEELESIEPLTAEGKAFLEEAQSLGVATPKDAATLYSGMATPEDAAALDSNIRNKAVAKAFTDANPGRVTLEWTAGGQWLDAQNIYKVLDKPEADLVWKSLSKTFVEQASGTIVDFTDSAESGSVFQSIELQAILDNPAITNLILGG